MRRFGVAITAAAAMLVAVVATTQAESPRDFAVGSIQKNLPPGPPAKAWAMTHIRFSAHSGPNGEDAKGQVHLDGFGPSATMPGWEEPRDVQGKVTCLNVITATRAWLVAQLDEPTPDGYEYIVLHVRDKDDATGSSAFWALAKTRPGACGATTWDWLGPHRGNVKVHNAP